MADCCETCKIKKYTYGQPANFKHRDGSGNWVPAHPPEPGSKLDRDVKAAIDALPKARTCGCGSGCECVEDKQQQPPYPKASVQRTMTIQVPKTNPTDEFTVTVEFTTYTGQCDEKV